MKRPPLVTFFLAGFLFFQVTALHAQKSSSTIDDEEVPEKFAKTPWAFEGYEEGLAYTASIERAVFARKFTELEALGAELREGKGLRFGSGSRKVNYFYFAITDVRPKIAEQYEKRLAMLDDWRREIPDSVVEPIARAEVLIEYGWLARGDGYANTVSAEARKVFRSRISAAKDCLMKSHERSSADPYWYATMQTVALAEGWSRPTYDRMFAEATKKFPDYFTLYYKKLYFLEPKWHGEEGEIAAYKAELRKTLSPTMYTRVTWAQIGDPKKYFKGGGNNDWVTIKAGFEEIMKEYPDSAWNLNNYCIWAVAAGDRATAKSLFDQIGDRYIPAAWDDISRFSDAVGWANGQD